MDGQNQHPNPVEDYMREIMSEDHEGQQGSISVPKKAHSSNPKALEKPIMENALKQRKPVFDPTGRIEQIGPDETKIADIRRHPIGLFLLYAQFIVGMALSVGLLIILVPSVMGNGTGVRAFLSVLVLVVAALGVVFLILATRVYKGNQLIVTDINVTEVQQLGLFNRKVSELTMANIEDVTASTKGIFQTIFNYGTITVETAGAQDNFIFKYCPNPNAHAKALQDVRQAFIDSHSEME